MFIVLLKFADNTSKAGLFMEEHNKWIQTGFDEGVFLLAGSLTPGMGGAVVATNTNLFALQQRVDQDPFVAEGVVSAEILEVTPNQVDDRLQTILG
jgi:uncharacterized protein YciI